MCVCVYVKRFTYIYTHIYICKEIYYKVLTHMIMEAERSHDLPSISWRPKETSIVLVQTLGTENLGSKCLRAGEDGHPSCSRKSKFTLPLPFCSI